MTEIETLCATAHKIAEDHGWWDNAPEFGTLIALCHCELSEALQDYREGHPIDEIYGDVEPEGVPVELADCVIRIMDACGYYSINLDEVIRLKMEYNEKREYRHGGKVI